MDITKINPNVSGNEKDSAAGQATIVNPYTTTISETPINSVLGGLYTVKERLDVSTGEADLYICEDKNNEYIAKVYRRQRAIKPEVISAVKTISSPYIAKLYHTGEYNGRPYEILTYYKNGSLQGKKFSLSELKNNIIPCINEALKVLHEHDIIHKDLKPSNIMILDDNKSVAIIDFGISSVVEDGNTILVTKTGMTPEYSAPETFRSLFLEESDYYSFGITLYELFCGYTPYNKMKAEEIAQYTAVQRIPFPKEMPEDLKELISALTYFDITNRNNMSNPNRRWTYNEVANWCKEVKQPIPGVGNSIPSEKSFPAYTFLGKKYNDIPSLVRVLACNWEDGKKQLFRGLMSSFFKSFNPEIAGFCMNAEEEASRGNRNDDVIFWDLLYTIDPNLNEFYWQGQAFDSLPALGRDMLEKLWQNDTSSYSYWDSILSNELLSKYVDTHGINGKGILTSIHATETAHKISSQNSRDRIINYYTVAYLLSGQKLFNIDGKIMTNVSELATYMKVLLESSYESFENFCNKMIDFDNTLNPQFEAWLISLGKRKEIESWKKACACKSAYCNNGY